MELSRTTEALSRNLTLEEVEGDEDDGVSINVTSYMYDH